MNQKILRESYLASRRAALETLAATALHQLALIAPEGAEYFTWSVDQATSIKHGNYILNAKLNSNNSHELFKIVFKHWNSLPNTEHEDGFWMARTHQKITVRLFIWTEEEN